jgi:hypothetical protein
MMAAAVAAVSMFAGTIKLGVAQQSSDVIGELANNARIFVDGNTFKIVRGAAKVDPSACRCRRRVTSIRIAASVSQFEI